MRGQESDNGHLFSFRANISGRLSRTCRDAACWGFVGETMWDFVLAASVYIAAPPPLGRGDDTEALL